MLDPQVKPTPILGQKKKTESSRLSSSDSLSLLALLVGVLSVIIVPPLLMKAILLICVSLGVFGFARYSHWTNASSGFRYITASVVVIFLIAVGVPQFTTQWKAEHPRTEVTQSTLSNQSEPPKPALGVSNSIFSGIKGDTPMTIYNGGKVDNDSYDDIENCANGTAIFNKEGSTNTRYKKIISGSCSSPSVSPHERNPKLRPPEKEKAKKPS
jgi:hypothetical protein